MLRMILVGAILLCSLIALSSTTEGGELSATGDVNCDGQIDTLDAFTILQVNVRLDDFPPCAGNSDVDNSSETDPKDSLWVLWYEAELIERFPADIQESH